MTVYEIVAPTGDICGEAPVWDPDSETVYWCDINRFLIHRFDPGSGNTRSWFFDAPVVALSLTTEPGRLLVALGSKLIWWWPATDQREDHGFETPGWPKIRLNDGGADPLGNFWVGSMENNVGENGEPLPVSKHLGELYRIDPDGSVTIWQTGIGISNTLCWSPDGSNFYFGDTLKNVIDVFHFGKHSGDIKKQTAHFKSFVRGLPDGSAIDSEGNLWNCRFYGGCIVRVDPDGTVLNVYDLPIKNITNAVFGGRDLGTLYVTSAMDQKDATDRLAGSLMAMEVEAQGLPPDRVRVPEANFQRANS